jgi:hypothetical protein
MFDITLAELLVLVTGAGLVLGRREITIAAHGLGRGLGRVVGTLQGLRFKYEEKTQGSKLYQLHKNVKDGLNDMGSITADIYSIRNGVGAMGQTDFAFGATSTRASVPSGVSESVNIASKSSNLEYRSGMVLPDKVSAVISAEPNLLSHNQISAVDFRLARLIVAEEQLKLQRGSASGRPQHNSNSSGFESGSDLVENAICESILNSARQAYGAGQIPRS